jgi:hypothetical protein
LGSRLRREAIKVWDEKLQQKVYVSQRLVFLTDLSPAFLGIHRCHGPGSKMVLLPWLSAYILAGACGGDLPTESQFRKVTENRFVQGALMANVAYRSPMFARGIAEWLHPGDSHRKVGGKDLRGERPPISQWRVAKAYWQLPELDGASVFADFPIDLTARPDREKVAAFRVVFAS